MQVNSLTLRETQFPRSAPGKTFTKFS